MTKNVPAGFSTDLRPISCTDSKTVLTAQLNQRLGETESVFSLADYQLLEDFQPIRNKDSFPSISDFADNSFGISACNVGRIC